LGSGTLQRPPAASAVSGSFFARSKLLIAGLRAIASTPRPNAETSSSSLSGGAGSTPVDPARCAADVSPRTAPSVGTSVFIHAVHAPNLSANAASASAVTPDSQLNRPRSRARDCVLSILRASARLVPSARRVLVAAAACASRRLRSSAACRAASTASRLRRIASAALRSAARRKPARFAACESAAARAALDFGAFSCQ